MLGYKAFIDSDELQVSQIMNTNIRTFYSIFENYLNDNSIHDKSSQCIICLGIE